MISFDSAWALGEVTGSVLNRDLTVAQPVVRHNETRWSIRFLRVSDTYRLDFDLARSARGQQVT